MRAFVKGIIIVAGILSLVLACSPKITEITYTTNSPEARRLFLEGVAKMDEFQFEQARHLFDQAIQADSTFAMAYYYRAETAKSAADFKNNLSQALKYVEKVSEPERLLIMSMDANSNDNPGEAKRFLEALVDLLPGSKRAHYELGELYFEQHEWGPAERELTKTTSIDAEFAPAYNILAYAYASQRKYPQAIEALEKYSQLRPDDPNPHDSMGDLYLYMGEYENSIRQFEKALQKDPSFMSSHAGIGHNYALTGQFDKARQQYDYYLTEAESVADTNAAYYWDAVSYVLEGQLDTAISIFEKQNEYASAHDDAVLQGTIYSQIAEIYLSQEQYDKALAAADTARQFADDPEIQLSNRQNLLRSGNFIIAQICSREHEKGEVRSCLSEYSKSAEISKSSINLANYHGLEGIVDYIDGNYRRAAEEFEQSNDQDMYQQYYYGLTEEALGHTQKARELFSRVAGWNHNSLTYALVRNKAIAKL